MSSAVRSASPRCRRGPTRRARAWRRTSRPSRPRGRPAATPRRAPWAMGTRHPAPRSRGAIPRRRRRPRASVAQAARPRAQAPWSPRWWRGCQRRRATPVRGASPATDRQRAGAHRRSARPARQPPRAQRAQPRPMHGADGGAPARPRRPPRTLRRGRPHLAATSRRAVSVVSVSARVVRERVGAVRARRRRIDQARHGGDREAEPDEKRATKRGRGAHGATPTSGRASKASGVIVYSVTKARAAPLRGGRSAVRFCKQRA